MSSRFLKIAFVMISLSSSFSQAWKEVGNAAGISEQNLAYAKDNSAELLRPLWSHPQLGEEKIYLQAFAVKLASAKLIFNYDQYANKVFSAEGTKWTLFSQNILAYDLDQNESLNLQESFLLLLDIYRCEFPLAEETYLVARNRLSEFLQAQEHSLILSDGGFRLQWSQYSVSENNSYILFYPDTETLSLGSADFKASLCEGVMTEFLLFGPFIKSTRSIDKAAIVLLGTRAQYRCDGQSFQRDLLLEIEASSAKSQMQLRAIGVLN